MSSEGSRSVERHLKPLAVALCDVLEWKWDGRFGTALAEFSADRAAEIQGILEQSLASVWDASTLKEAPDTVQAVARKLGGLMPGQRLLLIDPELTTCVFCAWWPWGNGTKISIRIGLFSNNLSDEEATELAVNLRDGFKI